MTDETTPLSLDSAVSLLASMREEKPQEQAEQTQVAAEEVQESQGEAPAVEQAAPEGDEGADEAVAPIDPPTSWSKADKEFFESLPRETQQVIAQRERARDSETNRRLQEAAAKEKELQEKFAALEAERAKYQELILKDAPKPPNPELIDSDPVEYLRQEAAYKAKLQEYEATKSEATKAERQRTEEARLKYDTWLKDQIAALADPKSPLHIPGYADEARGVEIKKQLAEYALKLGVEQSTLPMLSAMEANVLWKAKQWDDAQKRAAEAKVKPVPKVGQPGTAKGKADIQEEKRREAFRRLDKTGSIEDALALLRMN